MNGNNVQKLQLIDPDVLKSLLHQLNENTKRTTIANIIDESGMNQIIHDSDEFVAAPEGSELKESYRQNLLSRIEQYKGKRTLNLRNRNRENSEVGGGGGMAGNDGGGGDNDNGDQPGTSGEGDQSRLHVASVKKFRNRFKTKGFKRNNDGYLITSSGKKTNIPYDGILNDFGRNIKKKSSFMLTEKQKKRVMRILGDVGFAQYNIPNQLVKTAYRTAMPDLRNYLIQQASPVKKKKKGKKQIEVASGEIPWKQVRRQIYKIPDESDE